MVLYEVNLSVNHEIYQDYKHWLNEHIQQMLKFPGFVKATVLRQTIDNDTDSQKKLTIQYQLESTEHLQEYFKRHAQKMRAEGVIRFEGKFTATRRIFEIEATFT